MYAIQIDTTGKMLRLMQDGNYIRQYSIAVGKPATPSPKGNWTITKKALWGNQFGGHFMQLSVPWGIYGIHGTNEPSSIGQAASHGCIRMHNENAAELYGMITLGTPVAIY